jgi:hypothetical protein
MANWQTTVRFKDLCEEFDTEAEDELGEVERVKPKWIERFNQYPILKTYLSSLERVKTESAFNKWLNSVYDYCDQNLIWVE